MKRKSRTDTHKHRVTAKKKFVLIYIILSLLGYKKLKRYDSVKSS